MSRTDTTSLDSDLRRRLGIALAILRIALGLFLLIWGLEKFIVPSRSVEIYGYFYGISASDLQAYVIGILESLLALAIIFGVFRRWSYGIGLFAHSVTTVVTVRLIIDPWGLISGDPQHLYLSAVPILAGFLVLYLLRDLDCFSFDGRRAAAKSKFKEP